MNLLFFNPGLESCIFLRRSWFGDISVCCSKCLAGFHIKESCHIRGIESFLREYSVEDAKHSG
jgi:hypothetical protein